MPIHPLHPTPGPIRLRFGLLAGLVLALRASGDLQAQDPEKTAGETYKNIQVLKDAPASRFMNTMFFQRYALGVSCNYCHVGAEWAKDDKPAKLRAREMIRMVLTLNATVFKDQDGITCYTCHRGSTKPATDVITNRIPVETMLNPRPAAPRAKTVVPNVSVDSVIRRYVAALGGEAALEKVSSRMIKGNMITAEGAVVAFEEAFASAPARWVSIRHFGSGVGDFLTGYDGAVAWNKDNRGTSPQREPNRSQTLMAAGLQTGRSLASLYEGLAVTGMETVGDEPAVILSGVAKFGRQQERLYFGMTSGLLLRRSFLSVGMYGLFTTDQYFERYRPVDGVMIPILVSEFTPDFGTVRKVASVEHNGTLDPAIFAMPKP